MSPFDFLLIKTCPCYGYCGCRTRKMETVGNYMGSGINYNDHHVNLYSRHLHGVDFQSYIRSLKFCGGGTPLGRVRCYNEADKKIESLFLSYQSGGRYLELKQQQEQEIARLQAEAAARQAEEYRKQQQVVEAQRKLELEKIEAERVVNEQKALAAIEAEKERQRLLIEEEQKRIQQDELLRQQTAQQQAATNQLFANVMRNLLGVSVPQTGSVTTKLLPDEAGTLLPSSSTGILTTTQNSGIQKQENGISPLIPLAIIGTILFNL